uniref:hypothetical protein n=1 Tax=Gemmiger formicilis TaxID=745368 RepID=UPI003FED90A0
MNNGKNRQGLAAAAALAFGVLVLAVPEAATRGFAGGTALCLQSVLPALFPFFVVCELLTAAPPLAVLLRPMQRVLGLESAETARALLLSWVGGYAVCARLAGQLYGAGRITRRDAALLQVLGCCSGPGFVIGCVGGALLGNVRLGVVLYAAQIGANLGAGAVCQLLSHIVGANIVRPSSWRGCAFPERPLTSETARVRTMFAPTDCTREVSGRSKVLSPTRCGGSHLAEGAKGLPQAISSAVTSSLSVCGCVVFFRIVGAVLLAVLPLPPTAVSAALEVSAGCADFAALGGAAALYGCCACLSVLGVSVWAQLRLFAGAAYRPRLLVFSRAVHLVLLQLLVRVCAQLLPGSVTACSTLAARVLPVFRLPPDAAAAGFVFLCAALYKARQSIYNK